MDVKSLLPMQFDLSDSHFLIVERYIYVWRNHGIHALIWEVVLDWTICKAKNERVLKGTSLLLGCVAAKYPYLKAIHNVSRTNNSCLPSPIEATSSLIPHPHHWISKYLFTFNSSEEGATLEDLSSSKENTYIFWCKSLDLVPLSNYTKIRSLLKAAHR